MVFRIKATNVGKKFRHGYIFKNLNFEVSTGEILSIAGRNGAGKTTLLKIVAGLVLPEKGHVDIFRDTEKLHYPFLGILGYFGPYLELYDQLTALENLSFFAGQLGIKCDRDRLKDILEKVNLQGRENDFVGNFSSGMKQRMKYAVLYLKEFPIYLLDEPTSNFDQAGRELFLQFVEEHRQKSIVVIASNVEEEVQLGDQIVQLS